MNSDNGQTSAPRVEIQVHFATGNRGRKRIREGPEPQKAEPPGEPIPRLAQLLSLALRWSRLIEEGVVASYAEIASMMGLSRARVTQIMLLRYLAPEIQERILASPPDAGLERLTERSIRALTGLPAWDDQRQLWVSMVA